MFSADLAHRMHTVMGAFENQYGGFPDKFMVGSREFDGMGDTTETTMNVVRTFCGVPIEVYPKAIGVLAVRA